MKELDFDELDKAVNSLMAKTDITPGDQSVPVVSNPAPVSQPSVTLRPLSTPSVSVPVSSSIAITSLSSTPKPPLPVSMPTRTVVKPPVQSFTPSGERPTSRPTVPAKRSGRFMDLVPSSSELKSPMKSPSPRQGTTLSPINENVVADEPAPSTPLEPVVPTAPQVSTPSPRREFSQSIPPSVSPLAASMSMSARTKHDDMPDPLDIHEQNEASTQNDRPFVQESKPLTSSFETASEPIETPRQTTQSEPAVSPFLSDAKVDKRPLGSANPTPSSQALSNTLQSPQLPLPAELNTDLLAVESDHSESTQTRSSSPIRTQQNAELAPPISIAQQYKQQPRTGDQSHAPVYDTAAHPVAHPEKKKSNMLLIIVIASIIIIGGGGVAALFYLGYI